MSESGEPENRPPLEPKQSPNLIAKYSLFRQKLDPKIDVVYHPCGANDISPSIAFPGSRVIYVDIDKNSVEALKKGGFEAYAESALQFNPGNVDILIMLNPQIPPDIPSSHLAQGGFVLCNDYHATASDLHKNKGYELKAIIRPEKGKSLIFDTENLEDYWKEVETEEEFKNAPLSWGGVENYATAAEVVKSVTGKKDNVLAELKKILEKAREEYRKDYDQEVAKNPQMAKFMDAPKEVEILPFDFEGYKYFLSTSLPRKKGTVDDIFVFQKKELE